MAKIAEQECEAGGLRWFYREALPINKSDKLPVVLLHGLVSQSYSWREVMTSLADVGFRAIAPDWIGHGYSSKPDKREFDYTPEAFVNGLETWLDSLEIDRFYLVVQGFLGSAGLLYAAKHADKIERLVILNTPLTTDAKLPFKISQLGIPLVGDMLTQDPILVDRTLEGGGPYEVGDKDLEIYRQPFLKSSDAGRSLLATVKQLQLKRVLPEIDQGFADWSIPTLIVWGIADKWLPVSLAKNFAKTLKEVELAELEETGHYAQEDWSEKVSEVVVPFLRRMAT
ncbi:alpha/beta fold hydrolase [cf. Phormidesmis sp. LEGE 11477]|uniref:alpha/beta fold hydrolase n=1 Tax=cf. Phormidesmis sp. LEGE 11477 TaxID=1828680 RepID=UPI001880BB59|nr:alpha/beta fold hydrolase [cf. Phormidesmis sp. LEGE 11477]